MAILILHWMSFKKTEANFPKVPNKKRTIFSGGKFGIAIQEKNFFFQFFCYFVIRLRRTKFDKASWGNFINVID